MQHKNIRLLAGIRTDRGPYRVVCLPHTGPYRQIGARIIDVRVALRNAVERTATTRTRPAESWLAQKLGPPCGIYFDDPSKVSEQGLRSRGGYLLTSDASAWLLAAARPSLDVIEIPRREVLVARFKGHPLLSPYKVYPVMAEWMAGHGLQPAGPAVEFYRDGIVECELPVAPAADPAQATAHLPVGSRWDLQASTRLVQLLKTR